MNWDLAFKVGDKKVCARCFLRWEWFFCWFNYVE